MCASIFELPSILSTMETKTKNIDFPLIQYTGLSIRHVRVLCIAHRAKIASSVILRPGSKVYKMGHFFWDIQYKSTGCEIYSKTLKAYTSSLTLIVSLV